MSESDSNALSDKEQGTTQEEEENYEDDLQLEANSEHSELTLGEGDDNNSEDPELEAIKARVRDMEEEADKLRKMQEETKQMSMTAKASTAQTLEEKMEADERSIYVGNVDYSATADDLERHFHGCGSVNRVTILTDKFSGHPKGFAYIEFSDKDSVQTATALDESLFKGRQIKVTPKRTNRPGLSSTNRGRGGRGRGRGFRGFSGYRPFRGRGFRGRGAYYSPY